MIKWIKKILDDRQEQVVNRVMEELTINRAEAEAAEKEAEASEHEAKAMHDNATSVMLDKLCPINGMAKCNDQCVMYDKGRWWVDGANRARIANPFCKMQQTPQTEINHNLYYDHGRWDFLKKSS